MKKTLSTAIATALLAGTSTVANADISANVGFVSDYVWRGQSQTDNNPAIQGGLDYSHSSGFYLGAWGSNITFANSLELDFYGGYAGKVNDKLGYDVGVIYYDYPSGDNKCGGKDCNYTEIYGKVSYDFGPAAVSVGINYSPEFAGESGNAEWYFGEVDVPLPQDFSLNLHLGRQVVDDNVQWGTPNWTEWKVGVSKSFAGLDFGLAYTDTSLSKNDCFGGGNICDGRVVFSVGKSF